ncbi:MAG: hypothetical protein M3R01_07445, partial [Actinomycetota bacterium]|nr:hypothetical protein [Actinomycetota bacterium]
TRAGAAGASLDRAGSTGRRASWSVADQGLSSLTNFALAILVARSASTGGFGAFELTYSIYLFFVGASRAVSSEPLLVRHSDQSGAEVRTATAQATGTALVVGAIAGVACLVVAQAFQDPSRDAIRALGLVLPGLLLQDAWRFSFFAAGRPAKATANDGLWALSQLVIVLWLLQRQDDTPIAAFVLAWGASAGIGAVVGAIQAKVLPRPLAAATWLRRHRDLGPRFLGEFGVGLGAAQLALWLIGVVGGLRVLGALRAAVVVLGPFRILVSAAPGAAIPELIRLRNRSLTRFARAVTLTSVALSLLIGAWGVAAYLMPTSVGESILGENWAAARPLLLLTTLSWSALGLVTGAMIGLRSLAAARRSFRARLAIAPAVVIVSVVSVSVGGATGAAGGLAAVSCGSALVWWYQFRAALADARRGEMEMTEHRESASLVVGTGSPQ